jgi:hypothetical protein
MLLSELAPLVNAAWNHLSNGSSDSEMRLKLLASYAHSPRQKGAERFAVGEGLVGQCAAEKQRILLNDPPADYVEFIEPGWGCAAQHRRAPVPSRPDQGSD